MTNRLTEPMDFDTARVEVTVTIGGQEYTLREATAAVAARFVNARSASIRVENGKIVGFKDIGSLPAQLLTGCLYEGCGDRLVSRKTVDNFPARVQEQLFNRALDISGLRERDERVSTQLKEALEQEDAPIRFDEFVEWVSELDPEKFKNLRATIMPKLKDAGGNLQEDTLDGST